MKELTDDQILEHLKKDTIGRNEQLSVLVKLLNSAQENTVLAIDGPWGSGKTVFIKQLLVLADKSINDYGQNIIDDIAVNELREKQRVFYFNAWENDYLGDALGAILLKLIADSDEGLNEAAIKRAFGMVDPAAAIKNLSHDLINLSANTERERLVEHIQAIVNRHDAVNNFLEEMKGDSQRVVFVIDELDRCKPSFAVDLLEVIKHYFVRDDVTFILAENTQELSHTIQKYYGYNFNGSAYLNKFFDFSFSLQPINIENYIRLALQWTTDSRVVDEVAYDAINYYDFEMREINSYRSALRLVEGFLTRNRNWNEEQWSVQLIFTPLALALKIKNDPRFSDFIKGKGQDVLRDFLPSSDSAALYARKLIKGLTDMDEAQVAKKATDELIKHYDRLFAPDGRRRSRGESLRDFHEVISLMSAYTTVTEPKEKE